MIKFVKLPWFKGTPVYWNHVYFNNGRPYRACRLFCLSVRIYLPKECNGFCGEYECKENQANCKRIKR